MLRHNIFCTRGLRPPRSTLAKVRLLRLIIDPTTIDIEVAAMRLALAIWDGKS